MLRTLQCFGGVFCCAVQIEQHALKNVNDCGVIRNCVNFESIKVAEKTGIHSAICQHKLIFHISKSNLHHFDSL
jgi:hypothetical protein